MISNLEALLGVEEGDAPQRLVELRDQGAVLQVRRLGKLQVESCGYPNLGQTSWN